MSALKGTTADVSTGQVMAKQGSSRFHVDHWRQRIYHKTFTRGGTRHELPEWSVRLQHLGRREAFALGTVNAAVAAAKAKEIAVCLEANGWDATLAKFKPDPLTKAEVCSVGEFLADVLRRSHLSRMTVRQYAVKLRKIVSDVAKLEAGLRGKARRMKYDHAGGGRKQWLAGVDGQRLDILSPEVVTVWRNRYVAKAGIDPLKRKSAERSAASILRCARALFAPDVTGPLKVKLTSNPFAGVKLKDPGPQRYHSEVNPEWLLACADRELRKKHPQQYLALFLCLWAGLRRKEADLLMWEQVDLSAGRIHIRRTRFFEPKTEEAQRVVDIAPQAVDILRTFMEGSASMFVLNGNEPNPAATYAFYRCDHMWRQLTAWLRSKGVRAVKAIHMLRKESGSLIASEFGIEAARQHLGHRDISTTSGHYIDKKKRIEVTLSLTRSGKLQAVESTLRPGEQLRAL